jgi:hypothetical protein
MLQKLITHNTDLEKLYDEGYQLEIYDEKYLLVHHIPYLNSKLEIKLGIIVCILTLASPDKLAKPHDHTVYFCGEAPCDSTGKILKPQVINTSENKELVKGLFVNHYFSVKSSKGDYLDYYEKIKTYAQMLCSHVQTIDPSATYRPERIKVDASIGSSVFVYPDTNSSRAEIEYLSDRFKNQRIAIIGMGGTGSYVLDLVSKTPVKEIHIYDKDIFQVHNAFRAPSATPKEKFDIHDLRKVDYYYDIYSKMHIGIIPHNEYITKENINTLSGYDFVFICVDNNEARSTIAAEILSLSIPFIDVGMGVHIKDTGLIGVLRVTAITNSKQDHLNHRIGTVDSGKNEYSSNIQIADLNCLNAAFAVIKWKKISGFYLDIKQEHNILYCTDTNKLFNEDNPT